MSQCLTDNRADAETSIQTSPTLSPLEPVTMRRRLILSLLICFFVNPAMNPSQQPTEMPKFEIEPYQFGVLRRGPKWTAESTPETERIQAGHMANIK
jgi:hypothetical protein